MTHPIIKQSPEDFYVEEILHFPLDGSGSHLWLLIEKRGMNTAYLKRLLARLCGCAVKDIGHSGLKDRRAVTRQWLSLPAAAAAALPEGQEENDACWRILARQAHGRKLRVGSHRENAFRIVVRNLSPAHKAALEAALPKLGTQGFPNYFGAQRFGRDNLEQARQWVARGRLPKGHEERGRVLSVLRAALFNAQLSARLADDAWQRLLPGDRAMLSGSQSHFAVADVDEALITRLHSGDLSPAGLLFGKGEGLSGQAAALAAPALAEWADVIDFLCHHAEADWRALRVLPRDLHWQWMAPEILSLSFVLPRGAFATALINHLLPDCREAGRADD